MRVGGNVQRFRGGLVFQAHGLLYHSTLGLLSHEEEEDGWWERTRSESIDANLEMPREALRGGISGSFLEPFCGHLSPKIDKVSEMLTLRYSHEGPCVEICLDRGP